MLMPWLEKQNCQCLNKVFSIEKMCIIDFSTQRITFTCIFNQWYFRIADCQNSFGIIFKSHADDKDKLYSFMVDETDVNKVQFLTSLAKSIAQTKCLADHVSAICMILLCGQGVVFLSTLTIAYICRLFSVFGGKHKSYMTICHAYMYIHVYVCMYKLKNPEMHFQNQISANMWKYQF